LGGQLTITPTYRWCPESCVRWIFSAIFFENVQKTTPLKKGKTVGLDLKAAVLAAFMHSVCIAILQYGYVAAIRQ